MRRSVRILAVVVALVAACAGPPPAGAAAPRAAKHVPATTRVVRAASADTAISLRGVEISARRPLVMSAPRRFGFAVGGVPAAYCRQGSGVHAGYSMLECLDAAPVTASAPLFTGIGLEFPAGRAPHAYLETGRVLLRDPLDVITAGSSELWTTSAGIAVHF
jgi:hypothetical protein